MGAEVRVLIRLLSFIHCYNPIFTTGYWWHIIRREGELGLVLSNLLKMPLFDSGFGIGGAVLSFSCIEVEFSLLYTISGPTLEANNCCKSNRVTIAGRNMKELHLARQR